MGLEHQNIGTHEHRVHEQACRHIGIGVVACGVVFVDRSFVGVCAVENPLACDTSQKPSELWNFWDIRLAIKHDALRVQARCHPTGRNFQSRALNPSGLIAFDKRVVIGQEVKTLRGWIATGLHSGANGAYVVA